MNADQPISPHVAQPIPTLVVAGLSSNAGKTTVMVALTQELKRLGHKVACFKCGPDYLDPSYHARASGEPSFNLDSWLMDKPALLASFEHQVHTSGADIALVEGVMGLFDGADPLSDEGSTAQIARWLNAPVLLVVDASGMARTFGALINALASSTTAAGSEDSLTWLGAIANRVGSAKHLSLLQEAAGSFSAAKDWFIAGLPKSPDIEFPSRHLGLVTARDSATTEASFTALAELAKEWLPTEAIVAALKDRLTPPQVPAPRSALSTNPKPSVPPVRIAMALDDAFHFYYPYNRLALERCGATLVPFSPIHDTALPDCDALWLGGGYPELFAPQLSANTAMRAAIREGYDRKMPILAECGGYMYLCQQLTTLEDDSYPMVGVIEGSVQMASKLKALGYATATCSQDTILGPTGTALRGHQFRYSDYIPPEGADDSAGKGQWQVTRKRTGKTEPQGFVSDHVVASYIHVHFASHPEAAAHFVAAARSWREATS